MRRLFDISPALDTHLAVWPGDTPLHRELLLDCEAGSNITLSSLNATVHLGAHADGPNHMAAGAPGIEGIPLEAYLGPCQVIRPRIGRNERIGRRHLVGKSIEASRLLFATGTYPDPRSFNEDFAAIDPELVEELAQQKVRLIGIDTPSVDLFSSKELPAHRAFLRSRMAILEGLVLDEVPEGHYELIALPLKLIGFDASPVRAVLRSLCE